jgi:hypothetical protein
LAEKQLKETVALGGAFARIVGQGPIRLLLWSDVEFLRTANELLVECRRMLKNTYVVAYDNYMDSSQQHQEMQSDRHFEHLKENVGTLHRKLVEAFEKAVARYGSY